MQANPDWHPEDIKAAIRKTGVTLSDLSARWGYKPNSVRVVLRRPWPQVEALIARHLRRQPWIIWPSRYDTQGKPLTRRYERKPGARTVIVADSNAGVVR